MIFKTISGSTYELDQPNKRIRRLNGTEDPTPRQGADGEWKTFNNCTDVREGNSVLIQWEGERCTVTSIVKSISSSDN
jgi:hypothetical protein